MRRWLPLVVVGLWSACAFDDSAPPEAVVQCASNAECPSGWRCSSLRGICLPRRDGDTVAPRLSGTVTPALARPGATVTVTVQPDEPLAGPPVVEVRSGSSTQLVEAAPDGGAWVFVVPADAPDQLLTFYGSAEDLAGNGAQGERLGTCLVDGTAPVVLSTRVTPARAAAGQAAVATVLLSEEVEAGARLLVSTAAGAPLLEVASTAPSGALRFEVLVPPGTADQALSLRVAGLVDRAGNPGQEAAAGTLEVDGTPPGIGALSLGGSRFSAQPGFNEVTVPISVTGASLVSACLDQLCQSATPGQLVTFPVSGQEPEGPYTVTVRASDDVGNQAQSADVVVLDFSPPRVQSLRVTPAVVAPGGTVAVTASFDELLAADTALTVTSSDGTWSTRVVAPASGANLATFDVQLPAATLPAGRFQLELSGAVDDVDNAAPVLDAGAFLLDVDAPVFLASDAGYRRRFSLQPGNDLLSVPTPAVAGATVVEVCLDADCQRFDGGVVTFAVTADAGEGGHALVFRAFDEVGNIATRFDVVTFDFTPPRVVSSDVRYVPPAGCPLLAVDAVTSGTGVTLDLATDEPLAAAPSPDAGALRLSLSSADDAGRAFSFAGTAPGGGLATGLLPITGVLADDVGNASLQPLAQLTVDVTRPAVPDATASGLFVYKRVPFGALSTTYQPRFTVGADAGVFEPNLQVRFWSASAGGLQMGPLVRVDANGALPLTTLPPVDLPKLYFEPFDSACNAPTTGRRAVPGMEVTATLGSKVAGSPAPNPHRFIEEYVTDPGVLSLAASREWGDAELGRIGGALAVTMNPALRWQGAGPSPGTIRCAWEDPNTMAVYLLGDNAWRLESHGLVDLGPLPLPVQANCVTASVFGDPEGFLASSYYGRLTRVNGRFVHTYNAYGPFTDLGWLAVGASGYYAPTMFAMPNQSTPYATSVWMRGYADTWSEVEVSTPLPTRPFDRRHFTQYGAGYPIVVGSANGDRQTWAFQQDYDGAGYEWIQLENAPDDTEAVQGFNGEVVLVGTTHQAWRLQSDGRWSRIADFPLAQPIVASYADRNGYAVMVTSDWALVHLNGTDWTVRAAPAPALGGYRTQGHSPAVGTLAQRSPDGGLLFHTAFADGGADATWTWDGTAWTRGAGTSPPMAAGVAALSADGTVIMLGKATTPDAGMLTFQYLDGGWVQKTGPTPPARVDHRLVLDRANRLLSLGGTTLPPNAQPTGGVYAYQASTGGWTQANPDSVLVRARPAVGTDPRRGVTVVFGGTNGSPLQDTWELDAGTWRAVPTTSSPSARAGASLTWDPQRELLVLTGGTTTSDTWLYDGTWRDMTPHMGAPPPSSLAAWDATTSAIASLGVTGDAWLAPAKEPAAHRFLVTETPPVATTVMGGTVRVHATSGGLPVSVRVWDGVQWVQLGQATGVPFTVSALAAERALANGLRIVPLPPAAGTPTRLQTDYVEFVTQYRVSN